MYMFTVGNFLMLWIPWFISYGHCMCWGGEGRTCALVPRCEVEHDETETLNYLCSPNVKPREKKMNKIMGR